MSEEKDHKEANYVNSKLFLAQIKSYYETDKMTNELAENIVKIAEGLSYNWRFIGYTNDWKEDMVGDAVVKMYLALENKLFDLNKGYNPFSYFNQIAWNAFSNRIKKENKQHAGLREYKQRVYEDEMSNPNMNGMVYVKPIMEHDENDGCYDD